MRKKIIASDIKFPDGFLWGTATSAHQVEGNNVHSDWWRWEKIKNLPESGMACDQHHLFRKDFRLAKEILNNNAHRLSIEWARIEPNEGEFDEKEILHYREVLSELKSLGFKTMVTLHHATNPMWFSKKGGWEKRENLTFFKKYVALCVGNFGDLIDYWIIINEPNIYVPTSYLSGISPPGKRSFILALRAYLNLAKAHKKAYQIIHRKNPQAWVSSSIQMFDFKAKRLVDKAVVLLSAWIMNFSFLYLTRGYHDFIALNYYAAHLTVWKDLFLKRKLTFSQIKRAYYRKQLDLGWPFYPEGIFDICKIAWEKYKLPIIITENGLADLDDSDRPAFIVDHLTWLNQAMKDGVDVRGYFYWSIMDTVEWGSGTSVKQGLFETNFKTFERIPRKSAYLYGEICKTNSIPRHLALLSRT